jgi:hypothetical protein
VRIDAHRKLQQCLARPRLNYNEPPVLDSLPVRMGIIVARIEA